MINIQSEEFTDFLNRLAEKSEHGIRPFSMITSQDTEGLWYDDNSSTKVDNHGTFSYPLISDCLIDKQGRNIVFTWTEKLAKDGVHVNVKVNDSDNAPYVSITFDDEEDFCIVVENGTWHTCY